MKSPLLSVERIIFEKISVEVNPEFEGDFSKDLMRLDFNYNGARFYRAVNLAYPDDETSDPKSFCFSFNLVLDKDRQKEDVILPYFVDVKAVAYMTYRSDKHHGVDRFTAVRATGYSILYGAMRELISNFTARSSHGLWMLPGADFNQASKIEAAEDEEQRLQGLQEKENFKAPKKKVGKMKDAAKIQSKLI